jgi:predicted enzyme related to lactoylglutathione lyase
MTHFTSQAVAPPAWATSRDSRYVVTDRAVRLFCRANLLLERAKAPALAGHGLRMEILEDKTQTMPIRNEHIHFSVPEAEIPKMQAWYAKTFGGKAGTRNNAPVVDVPGGQLRFAKADKAQAPTKGRVLDHIGFDVKDLQAFIKKIEAEGIKLDEPYRKNETTGVAITYVTDPWGTRIELVQRVPTS